jgi:hypothetical protein
MKRVLSESTWIAVALVGATVLAPAIAHAAAIGLPGQVCCVKGTWAGTITQRASPTCPDPTVNEPFTFVLTQDAACTKNVTGRVTTAQGALMNFVGTVAKTQPRCCHLEGTLTTPSDPAERVTVVIDFCPMGQNIVANGTAHSVSGPSGKQRVCDETLKMHTKGR